MARTSFTSLVKGSGAPLLWRALAFLAIFVITSGIIGPKIISAGFVNREGFAVYGGAGKALLFATLVFLWLMFRSNKSLLLPSWKLENVWWLLGAVLLLILAWTGVEKVITGHGGLFWVILTHVAILGTVLFGLLGSFSFSALKTLYRTYAHEVKLSVILGVSFVGFLYLVYGLWHVLANCVLHVVASLLHLSGLQAFIIPPQTLLLDKFGIEISQYCSGIDSIALFGALYLFIGILDWSKLSKTKFLSIFVPALIILFGINILRVYGLIMAGYYINPHIAFSLFHTYAGMVFFIVYSAIFWRSSYKWMLLKSP